MLLVELSELCSIFNSVIHYVFCEYIVDDNPEEEDTLETRRYFCVYANGVNVQCNIYDPMRHTPPPTRYYLLDLFLSYCHAGFWTCPPAIYIVYG